MSKCGFDKLLTNPLAYLNFDIFGQLLNTCIIFQKSVDNFKIDNKNMLFLKIKFAVPLKLENLEKLVNRKFALVYHLRQKVVTPLAVVLDVKFIR